MPNIVTRLDNTQLKKDLNETEQDVRRSNLAMITAIRQTAQAGILVLQVAGVAIDQVFALFVETLLVGIELSFRIAAATSIATFGITGVLQIGQIVAMLLLIRQIRTKQQGAQQQTAAAIQLLRMGTY